MSNDVLELLEDKLSQELFVARSNLSKKWVRINEYAITASCELIELLYDDVLEPFFMTRPCELGTMADALDKIRMSKVVLCGYGILGRAVISFMQKSGCEDNLVAIWEIDPALIGKKVLHVTIKRQPDDISGESFDYIISTTPRVDKTILLLRRIGVSTDKIISPFVVDGSNMYFDPEIITPRLCKDEIFIDGGALDFGTSRRLLEINPNVKKIYVYEPDPENYKKCVRNIANENLDCEIIIRNAAWYSNNGILSFKPESNGSSAISKNGNIEIPAYTIDSVVPNGELVTFIKLDVEGAEMDVLKGAKETIMRCKPKLAICVYHCCYDHIIIPQYIHKIVPEYKMYMRQYCGAPSETVLYCVL